jgi:hypothetical protein
MEVEATEPSTPEMRATLKSMSDKGVKYLYGRWLIEGGPNVLLFDTGSMMNRLDEWKSDLWNLAGIPTPPSDSETNETVVFGYMVAWFLGEVSNCIDSRKSVWNGPSREMAHSSSVLHLEDHTDTFCRPSPILYRCEQSLVNSDTPF